MVGEHVQQFSGDRPPPKKEIKIRIKTRD